MNAAHIFIALAAAIPALAQTSATLARSRASFDLIVHQPYPEAAKLFGPEGERAWAGSHWNPEFLHPQPAADVEGAVFTIQHGSMKGRRFGSPRCATSTPVICSTSTFCPTSWSP